MKKSWVPPVLEILAVSQTEEDGAGGYWSFVESDGFWLRVFES